MSQTSCDTCNLVANRANEVDVLLFVLQQARFLLDQKPSLKTLTRSKGFHPGYSPPRTFGCCWKRRRSHTSMQAATFYIGPAKRVWTMMLATQLSTPGRKPTGTATGKWHGTTPYSLFWQVCTEVSASALSRGCPATLQSHLAKVTNSPEEVRWRGHCGHR